MPDPTNGDPKTPAVADPKAPAATPPDPTPPAGDAATPAAGALSLEEARKLRKEHQQLRKEREELTTRLKAIEDAKLSDTERLTKERDELKARETAWAAERRERDARDEVIEWAGSERVGARNPRALYKLLRDELEVDDKTGRVTNLDALLKLAKAEYPEQFGRAVGSADAGAGSRQPGGAFDMNAEIRRRIHGA